MRHRKGYVILLSVLIVGAIGLSVATTFLLLGVDSSRTGLDFLRGKQARSLADACAEEALQIIWGNNSYAGTSNLVIGSQACTYTVVNLGGTSREIDASATVAPATRKVKVLINQLNPQINVTSWQEVGSF